MWTEKSWFNETVPLETFVNGIWLQNYDIGIMCYGVTCSSIQHENCMFACKII